ncbi:MAG: DNA-directed RNA polymerase subunit omega [Clostridium sp.]
MSNTMINPPIIELLEKVGNRYCLVTITAKRAREIIDGAEPLADGTATKPVTIAVNEVKQNKISFITVKEGIK